MIMAKTTLKEFEIDDSLPIGSDIIKMYVGERYIGQVIGKIKIRDDGFSLCSTSFLTQVHFCEPDVVSVEQYRCGLSVAVQFLRKDRV